MDMVFGAYSYNDRRDRLIEIFNDTTEFYSKSETLRESIKNSKKNSLIIKEGSKVNVPDTANKYDTPAKFVVSGKRTFEAAKQYTDAGHKVCVLNFASSTNPGGGVVTGSSAQEESLCRCSTLYPCLDTRYNWDNFYGPHRRQKNPLYNDDIIYSPGITVFKCDGDYPYTVPEEDWYEVDVITCAAPNLRNKPWNEMNPGSGGSSASKISDADLEKLLTKRIRQIFNVAVMSSCEVLILGAFGCGAFKNPPDIVAKVFKKVSADYVNNFKTIEFAIYHRKHETANFEEFSKCFS